MHIKLKPHNDDSEDHKNDNVIKFEAFAEELDSNWYDFNAYD